MKPDNNIFIVLLNYNSYEDTKDCIDSLLKCNKPVFDIVLVDNASSDNSLEKLRALYPQIQYIESKINKGFAGGCNLGIQYAYDQGADYVLLLNNDTVVDPNFLEALVTEHAVDSMYRGGGTFPNAAGV